MKGPKTLKNIKQENAQKKIVLINFIIVFVPLVVVFKWAHITFYLMK